VLTRLFADNFRALVNFELRPGKLSLLLGENGSGKTTVFDVLGSLRDLVILGHPVGNLFGSSRTSWDKRDVQRLELDLKDEGGTFRYSLDVHHRVDQVPFIRSETVALDGEPLFRFSDNEVRLYYDDASSGPSFPFRSDQSYLVNLRTSRSGRMDRLGRFIDFMAGIAICQPNPFAMQAASERDQDFLSRNGENFASFFDHINDVNPTARQALESDLKDALPGFQTFRFDRFGTGNSKVLFAVFGSPQQSGEYALRQLSEGQRVLSVLYAALHGLIRKGSLLCFDEPDNFVALTEIQPWLQTLRDSLDEREAQAMIISHHPEVIDYLATDSVWKFERPLGPVVAEPYEPSGEPDLRLSEIIVRGG
jgi:predicted ATPase